MSLTPKAVVKKTRPKEVLVVHSCTEQDTLKKICLVLFGNGHPEDGLAFLMREYIKDNDGLKGDIKEIKHKLSTVNDINTELEISRRVNIELEKERLKGRGDEVYKNGKTNTKRAIRLQTIATIGGVISICVVLLFSILNYAMNKKTKEGLGEVKEDVEYLQVPMVTRGNTIIPLPPEFDIKFVPKDLSDTTKKDTIR